MSFAFKLSIKAFCIIGRSSATIKDDRRQVNIKERYVELGLASLINVSVSKFDKTTFTQSQSNRGLVFIIAFK
jgi:hypothetical protein